MHPSRRPSVSCTADWCRFPQGRGLQPPVVTWWHSAGQWLPRRSPVHMGWWHHRVRKGAAAVGRDGAAHCRQGQRVPHWGNAMTQYCTHSVRLAHFLDYSLKNWKFAFASVSLKLLLNRCIIICTNLRLYESLIEAGFDSNVCYHTATNQQTWQ